MYIIYNAFLAYGEDVLPLFKLWELDDSTVVIGFRLGNLNLQSKSYNYNICTRFTLIANNYTHRVSFIRDT